MQNINTVMSAILADGKIDAEETATLRELLFADGKIDASEADLLFELNNKCSGAANDPSWTTLFVEAITSFLLDDEHSAGEIDENEAAWLLNKIQGDGKLDETERQLLQALAEKTTSMPAGLTDFIKANA